MVRRAVERERKAAAKKKPEPTKLTVVPGSKPRLRVSPDLLARARNKTAPKLDRAKIVNPFAPYQPPPGVVPKDHKLAMDSAVTDMAAWAGQSLAAGTWTEGLTFMGYAYLAELTQRPEYRMFSSVIATEMTRKWIKVQAADDHDGEDKTDKIKALEDMLKRLCVQDAFYRLAEQDGFFGRTHLFLDVASCDLDERDELKKPLDAKTKVTPDKPLRRIKVIEPIWCYPQQYNTTDPLKPDWYNPSMWFVMSKEIHASRLMTFVGHEVPDILKPAYAFGGLSRSQMAKPYVDNWLTTRQSVNDLIHAFSTMILMTDMSASLQASNSSLDGTGTGTADDAILGRLDLFNLFRDNRGVFALNKDTEDFKNVSTPLSTLDALQAQSQEHMASVSKIPLVKLLGIQPAGLNASSDGEIRVFYDTIAAFQEQFFRSGLERVVGLCQLSLWGDIDPAITIKFEQLWSLDEVQEATVRKLEAETDDILVNGVASLSPEESRKRVAADPDTPYASLDVEDMPEPPAPEEGEGSNISLRGTTKLGKGPAAE